MPAALLAGLTRISPATLAAAAKATPPGAVTDPKSIRGPRLPGAVPALLFVGAGYCPFCAAERWPLVVALSKFGTFHGLTSVLSQAGDGAGYSRVPSLYFGRARYSSRYLVLVAVDYRGQAGFKAKDLDAAERAVWRRYDAQGAIPFLYLDGLGYESGSPFVPSLLLHGSFTMDARAIAAGRGGLARTVDAAAGSIVSFLCRLTGGRPGRVCAAFPAVVSGS